MSSPRPILVTGGAGYVGSHTVRALQKAGYAPVVFDNFSSGHRAAVPPSVPIVEGDLSDVTALRAALRRYEPGAVIHLAAFIEAGASMTAPRRFYRNNVENSLNLLDAMIDADLRAVVFSSSAGVYGEPRSLPIPEDALRSPVNTYGRTKLMVEHILGDYDRAYALRSISLRYFNACGADASGEIGEAHQEKTHLIELALLAALGQRSAIKVFGTDYPTPDGTAVRDYVHVTDIADAHVRALAALERGAATTAYNVGLGRGFSVNEVLDVVDRVTKTKVPRVLEPRRAGDPAALVADPTRIREELGVEPRYTDLVAIVETAWRWHERHPHDFELPTSSDPR